MKPWIEAASQWADKNETLISWLTFGSLVFYFVTLFLIPWLIIRIPSDYFSNPGRYRSALLSDHPLAILVLKIVRNAVGIFLVAIGIVLLVLPGQGILTVAVGLSIADFPGKHKLVEWLVHKQNILRSMNWLRRKCGKEDIELPG